MGISKKKPRVVYFPSDFLKGKHKREYMKEGEIMSYNLYEKYKDIKNLPSKSEILEMDKEEAIKIIEVAKSVNTLKDIAFHWGYKSNSGLYTIFNKLGMEFSNDKRKKKVNQAKSNKRNGKATMEVATGQEASLKDYQLIDPVSLYDLSDQLQRLKAKNLGLQDQIKELQEGRGYKVATGISINLAGEFSGDQIESRVLGVVSTLFDGSKYKIKLEIQELEEEKKDEEQIQSI